MPNAITLRIYGEDDEVKREVSLGVVRWSALKRALRLQEEIDEDNAEGSLDAIGQYLVDVFDGRLSMEEIENADVGDVLNVFFEIVGRAGAFAKTLNFKKGKA